MTETFDHITINFPDGRRLVGFVAVWTAISEGYGDALACVFPEQEQADGQAEQSVTQEG